MDTNTIVRAKFKVDSITLFAWPEGAGQVSLSPVFASQPGVDGNACEENHIFGKYTPSGSVVMSIHNPAALKPFQDALNEKRPLYVDFTPAEN